MTSWRPSAWLTKSLMRITNTAKKRLIEQWASASAACMVDALVKYADSTEVPLSELVSDDRSFSLKGGPDTDFDVHLSTCIEGAWEAIGANLEY